MNKEIRQSNQMIESSGDRTVSGYAVVFDTPSDGIIGWTETIAHGAITNETLAKSDIFANLNHDNNKVLARYNHQNGSLKLELDDKGLKYTFDAPNTTLGDELLEYIRRGEITQSSFCFTVSADVGSDKWWKEDGKIYRTIYKIDRLFDIAPVFQPAYGDTTCVKRFNEISEQSNEIDTKMNLLLLELDFM